MKEIAIIIGIICAIGLLILSFFSIRAWLSSTSVTTKDWIDDRSGQRYIVFTTPDGVFVIKAEPDRK